MSRFHHTQLSNGLNVIAERVDHARSISAGFFVKTGSRDETPSIAGISHFLEHMAFKGSDKRDALAVNRDFDKVGAKHNAQTSEEDTVYHFTSLPEYLPPAFEVLADIMRPKLDATDFDVEKQVILEEIKMYMDNAMSVAYEAARELHFTPHPLGRSVLGTLESVGALTIEEMRDYYARRYGPSNIVLAFSGRIDWPALVDMAAERCGDWTGVEAKRVTPPAKGTGKFRVIERAEDNQQSVVMIADAPSLESPDRYAAQLLATALGDHTGSRLYWTLIDPGLADGAEVSYQDYNQAGAFYTFLGCDPAEAEANIQKVVDVYKQVRDEGIAADELEVVKNKVLSRSVLRGERPMGRLMSIGFTWSYRREYIPLESEIEAFQRVTPADVKRVLEEWPQPPMTITTVGPKTSINPPDFS